MLRFESNARLSTAIILTGTCLCLATLSAVGKPDEKSGYKGHRSAIEYFERLQVGPARTISHEELKRLVDTVFDIARWTDLHPESNRPLEESCPLYQLLAVNLPTIKALYDRFDVRTNNLRFELESLGFKDPSEMDKQKESRERQNVKEGQGERYKGFSCAVIYIERLNVESPKTVSDDRLSELADIIFEASKWTGQHPECDFHLDRSCPIFQLLATNLHEMSALPESVNLRLSYLSVKLEELGFRENRKRLGNTRNRP